MTKTTALIDQTRTKPPASVAGEQRPGSLTDWGIASLVALRQRAGSAWLMTREERVSAYLRNELTAEQIQEWVGRAPGELPLLNGEFAHIAATTPEACVSCPVCGDDEVTLATGGVLGSHPDYRHPSWGTPGAVTADLVPLCPGSGERPQVTKAVQR